MVEDMLISGLFDHAASAYRAIVFDRPGFGHSERPRDRSWTAAAQAALFAKAFSQLGLDSPIVVGHSWGTLAALALAIHHPASVSGLVLASGYYFPTARSDVAVFSGPSIPLVSDAISYTLAPLIGELTGWPLIAKMFAPQPISPAFEREYPMPLAPTFPDKGILGRYVAYDSFRPAPIAALPLDPVPDCCHGRRCR
jgi:pimeloyl-ACP methyl ester carboxylesterase